MAERPIRNEVNRHIARNEKLVARIVALGGDLDELRTIDFFFYVPEERDAKRLAADLRNLAFHNVQVSGSKDQWAVTGKYRGSVAAITRVDFVERLASLAATRLGEFDGWGTAV